MPGVVTLLEGEGEAFVRELWREVWERSGLASQPEGGLPHVTYHVAERYAAARLEAAIRAIAAATAPFTVECSGLGVFTGSPLVLYLPVVRTRELAALQERVRDAVEPLATGTGPYWQEARWVPHITLAMEGLTAERAGALITAWAGRPLSSAFAIANLAVMDDGDGTHRLMARCALGGGQQESGSDG